MAISASKVKESLLRQLEAKGAKVDVYTSLIEDYVWLWNQQRAMQRDIKQRGRTYKAISSTGKEYEKNNPSVKDVIMYSRQMVSILDALGLSTKTVTGGAGDDAQLRQAVAGEINKGKAAIEAPTEPQPAAPAESVAVASNTAGAA